MCVCVWRGHIKTKKKVGEVGVHGENLFWAVPPLQWVCLISSFVHFFRFLLFSCPVHLMFPFSVSLWLCVFLATGQSLTSVKVKAGEALRLHRTSVGEEAREEEDGAEETREEVGESGEANLSSNGESSSPSAAASGRGVFSTITHAVQNTVSEHTHSEQFVSEHKPVLMSSLVSNINMLGSRKFLFFEAWSWFSALFQDIDSGVM